jgi:hypothetical protein
MIKFNLDDDVMRTLSRYCAEHSRNPIHVLNRAVKFAIDHDFLKPPEKMIAKRKDVKKKISKFGAQTMEKDDTLKRSTSDEELEIIAD